MEPHLVVVGEDGEQGSLGPSELRHGTDNIERSEFKEELYGGITSKMRFDKIRYNDELDDQEKREYEKEQAATATQEQDVRECRQEHVVGQEQTSGQEQAGRDQDLAGSHPRVGAAKEQAAATQEQAGLGEAYSHRGVPEVQGSREKAGPGGEEQDFAGGQDQAGRGKNLAGSPPEWGAVK